MNELTDSVVRHAIELTLIPEIGTITQSRIRAKHPDMGSFFGLSDKAMEMLGIPPEARHAAHSRAFKAIAEEIYDWGPREGCAFIVRGQDGYPSLLEEIYDPPLVLYARGNLECLNLPGIAIVGTRRPTIYGQQIAEGVASDLAERGIAIISGLARGIDGSAHRGCLEANGNTIAILGCGIDVVYPREHKQLTNKILDKGLLLSEFPPGVSPSPQNFPIRNRIISGLAFGTLVIEAGEYSGSLITARLAMEQNREVYAIPGNITSPRSFGPNFLIKQGAKLVQSWRDVVEEFPSELRQKMLIQEDSRQSAKMGLKLLSDEESKILGVLKMDEAIQFDTILRGSGLTVSELSGMLLNLEMSGWLRQLPGNFYVKLTRQQHETEN